MECTKTREKLGFYLDGTLNEQTLELVETHLAQCEQCSRELAAMKILINTARQAEMLEPPTGLRENILQAVANIEETAEPLAKASCRSSFMDWLRSGTSPTGLRWAAGIALAGCAALVIFIGASHEPVQKRIAREIPKPVRAIAEKNQPKPKSAIIIEPTSSEPAQLRSTGKPVRQYAKRHTVKHSVIIATRPAKSLGTHANHQVAQSGNKGIEKECAADAQETDVVATQTAAVPETVANAEPVNEQPVVVKVAAAPVFDNEKIHEWMQQAKMQAEMRKNRDSRSVINIVSTRF